MMNEIVVTPEYVQSLGAGIRRMIINTMTPLRQRAALAQKDKTKVSSANKKPKGRKPRSKHSSA